MFALRRRSIYLRSMLADHLPGAGIIRNSSPRLVRLNGSNMRGGQYPRFVAVRRGKHLDQGFASWIAVDGCNRFLNVSLDKVLWQRLVNFVDEVGAAYHWTHEWDRRQCRLCHVKGHIFFALS